MKTIKLTKNDLQSIIKESIEKVLKENMLQYKILSPKAINKFEGYDRSIAQTHIDNFGFIIVDAQYGDVIDDEYRLDEIIADLKAKGKF